MIIQEQGKLLYDYLVTRKNLQEQDKLLHDYLGRMLQRAPLTPQ